MRLVLAKLILRLRRDAMRGLVPPEEMNFVGSGDYEQIGQEFFGYFVRYGRLMPWDRVLDVGCGIGRMARPLAGYLSRRGEYWGFDIVRDGIDWCRARYGGRFPNFHFDCFDLRNSHYNRSAEMLPRDLGFPYRDGYFDFVFLTSVFTHMLPADMEHYLAEIARVLKPGGRCLMTFFLLNDESLRYVATRPEHFDFRFPVGEGALAVDAGSPETTVAYPESEVRRLMGHYGFSIDGKIHYGAWCGRASYLSGQDILVVRKCRSLVEITSTLPASRHLPQGDRSAAGKV